ncbi:MAG: histidinol-phosphatase HisJ [Promethearchaeota archaeon]
MQNVSFPLWDYHVHSKRCGHAVGKLSAYVQRAIDLGLKEIGLSDHFPMFFLPPEAHAEQFAMKRDEFPEYLAECQHLQKQFSAQIRIKIASEVDFFPDSNAMKKLLQELRKFLDRLDYIIGSIHIIQVDDNTPFAVDSPDIFEHFKHYGEETIFSEYYHSMIELVRMGIYQIVGHCDLPKKYGTYLGKTPSIWEMKLKFLDEVKLHPNMAVEINHSGLYKPVGEQYPHDEMIEALIERKIPIVFGSDAHRPKDVGYQFRETFQKCRKFAKKLDKPLILAKFTRQQLEPVIID